VGKSKTLDQEESLSMRLRTHLTQTTRPETQIRETLLSTTGKTVQYKCLWRPLWYYVCDTLDMYLTALITTITWEWWQQTNRHLGIDLINERRP